MAAINSAASFKYERLSKTDAALIIVDLQVGLSAGVRDWEPTLFHNNMLAHSYIGKMFDLPVVLTTSAETGPNGPLPKEILEMHPDAPVIRRDGEVNAWDSADFKAAVRATGKKQMILAGITTDVCVAFAALSLRQEGYHVVVNMDASGCQDPRIAQYAAMRMQAAGVQIMSTSSITAELFRDWRSKAPGDARQAVHLFDSYIGAVSFVIRSHGEAVKHGKLIPGEETVINTDASTS